MATHTTHICDRCGKECTSDKFFGTVNIETTATICNLVAITYESTDWDLCQSCSEKLRDFLYKGSES